MLSWHNRVALSFLGDVALLALPFVLYPFAPTLAVSVGLVSLAWYAGVQAAAGTALMIIIVLALLR